MPKRAVSLITLWILLFLSSASISITLPVVTSADPSSAPQGWTGEITITGQNFDPGAKVRFASVFGDGIISAIDGSITITATFKSSTSLTVNISVDSTAIVGTREVVVLNQDGGSGSAAGIFSVVSSVAANNPSIESVTNPRTGTNEVAAGETTNLVINGSNFTTEAGVSFSSGITVVSINSVSSDREKLNITVKVASDAVTGYKNITVKNNPGTANVGIGTLSDGLKVVSASFPSKTFSASIAAPQYPAGTQYYNPDAGQALAVTIISNVESNDTTILLIDSLGAGYRRKSSIITGINTINIPPINDFGESWLNGIYKLYVIDNQTSNKIATGKIVVYR